MTTAQADLAAAVHLRVCMGKYNYLVANNHALRASESLWGPVITESNIIKEILKDALAQCHYYLVTNITNFITIVQKYYLIIF